MTPDWQEPSEFLGSVPARAVADVSISQAVADLRRLMIMVEDGHFSNATMFARGLAPIYFPDRPRR